MLKRIAVAIRWVVYFHWRYRSLRYSLRTSFGREFVKKSLPPESARRLWISSAEVVATAWCPPQRKAVQHRTTRFRKVISALRRLDDQQTYVVKTPAGLRVYGSAIARCWKACTDQDVGAEIFASQQTCSILKTLIAWLERSGVEKYEIFVDPKACNVSGIDEAKPKCSPLLVSKTSEAEREIREIELKIHRTEFEASSDLADTELEILMIHHYLRYLALPEAILMANEHKG
jgi:hypothetical protein